MIDVLIIGGGPAGVSAALYTARARYSTTILYKNHGALQTAEAVENFYGHKKIGGHELVETGLQQAQAVGAELICTETTGITLTENNTIQAQTASGQILEAKAAIIATGATRVRPKIEGLEALEGMGVSYCAICDGFFYRGKDVAVLGSGAYALHEAQDLLPLVKSVTLLTNGETPSANFPEEIKICQDKIEKLTADKAGALENILTATGEKIPATGLFIAMGIAGGTELARKIGAQVENNAVIVDKNMRTLVPGLWAAGDCTGGLKQIAKAVYQGAEAGMDIIKFLREWGK
ncbi:MAG: NAD(P)/FAD-dependent oxidoreductase [Defluviitaleaceae bacterium]|nr:NAD(P)/FAD-dependent oxidoreductase [Defluviitaleaceae bacterium]